MKSFKLISSSAIVLFVLMVPNVHATTVGECKGLIDIVEGTLGDADIGGKNPDRTRAGLESKLDGASMKVSQAKFADAIDKMTDFKYKVQDMTVPNRKGETKIDPDDAFDLEAGANEAIDCIEDLLAY